MFLALHQAIAAEPLLRKGHVEGREEIDVDNRMSRCSYLPAGHSLQKVITMRRRGKMTRRYRIMTPARYNPRDASKVLLYFHGWGEDSSTFGEYRGWVQAARDENYVVVVPEGIQNSWQFPGSSDGVGTDGGVTACNTRMRQPDYCYDSCPCRTRCGWTQCQDDDLEFVLDLIQDIQTKICVDNSRLYAMGVSNGGMLTWSMAQDRRIAPLLAGIAPMIGVPHNDYSRGKATSRDLPVIGFYGQYDDVVPPGNFREDITEDSAGYYWIPAHRMHTKWAQDHDCLVRNKNGMAPYTYYESNNLQNTSVRCRTHCSNSAPFSVDCRAAMGHDTPDWMMSMALQFFERHHNRRRK